MTWEQWKTELEFLAGDAYGPQGPIKGCGEQCWWESFRDGLTPAEALREDQSNWDN